LILRRQPLYSRAVKTYPILFLRLLVLPAFLSCGVHSLHADEPTAFELVKEGNRHIGEEAKDHVVQIRSDKSIGTLVPNIWFLSYYDPDASGKVTEVKFMAGQKVAVTHPSHLFGKWNGKEMAKSRLKIDSDKALETAKNEPVLKSLTLKASQLKLERLSADDDTPVWKVELWAAKLSNPNRAVSIGQVIINAETGKVLANDLKIKNVD